MADKEPSQFWLFMRENGEGFMWCLFFFVMTLPIIISSCMGN